MTQLVAGGSTALTAVAPATAELQLVARQPEEMQQAQRQLIAWFEQKIAACRREAADANDNLAIAQRSGWKLASFRRQSQLAGRRIAFYEKCQAAVAAGYALVPNFPVDVFAVRTTKAKPKGEEKTWNPGFSQKGEGAPLGAGQYVSELPFVEHRIDQVDDGKGGLRKVDRYWPSEFDDEIEYPLSIAQPAVMSATAEALARKVFDEIGSLPERRRKGDPIVVGRLRQPRRRRAEGHHLLDRLVHRHAGAVTARPDRILARPRPRKTPFFKPFPCRRKNLPPPRAPPRERRTPTHGCHA